MSTHDRRRPKLPPPLEVLFREVVHLRQGPGLTMFKLAESAQLLTLRAVVDEANRTDTNLPAAAHRVLECQIARHRSERGRRILRSALNFEEVPGDLTFRRNTLARALRTHVDVLRADETELVIELITRLSAARRSPCSSPLLSPAAVAIGDGLVGRDDVTQYVLRRLAATRPDGSSVVVLLHGMPGVGKTALARLIAGTLAAPRGIDVLELSCEGLSFDDILFTLAIRLLDDRSLFYASPSTATRVAAIKRGLGRRPPVVLADDVANPEVAGALVGVIGEGMVVMTGADAHLWIDEDCIPVRVTGVGPSAAAQILGDASGIAVDPLDPSFAAINERVGGNPLALKLLGARLRRSGDLVRLAAEFAAEGVHAIRVGNPGTVRTDFARHIAANIAELDESTVRVVRSLGAFPAGAGGVAAVASVSQLSTIEVGFALDDAVDHNLVESFDGQSWALHPLVADYLWHASVSLDERERLLGFYRDTIRAGQAQMRTAAETAWLQHLDHVSANVDRLLDWGTRHSLITVSAETAAGLGWYWTLRGRQAAGRDLYARILASDQARQLPDRVRGALLEGDAWLATNSAEFGDAANLFQDAAEVYRAASMKAQSTRMQCALAYALWGCAQYDEAEATARNVLAGRVAPAARASALNVAGLCASHRHPPAYQRARRHLREAKRIRHDIGDEWGEASSDGNLAEVDRALGASPTRISKRFARLVGVRRAHGDIWGVANALNCQAEAIIDTSPSVAVGLYVEALSIGCDVRNPLGVATTLVGIASLAHQTGHARQARRVLAEIARLLHNVNVPVGPSHRHRLVVLHDELGVPHAKPITDREWFDRRAATTQVTVENIAGWIRRGVKR